MPELDGSILDSIKTQVGVGLEYGVFDIHLITNINATFMTLYQLGVGPKDKPYYIKNSEQTWSDFSSDETLFRSVEQYVYIKALLVFDPPTNTSVLNALKETAAELEWRLQEQCEWIN